MGNIRTPGNTPENLEVFTRNTVLETDFYTQHDRRSYIDIIDELEKIKCQLNQASFGETFVFDLDSLFSAVEQLLTKNTLVGTWDQESRISSLNLSTVFWFLSLPS